MFQLPDAKRVRRSELHSPTSSPRTSPDPDLQALFLSKVQQTYETVAAPEPQNEPTEHDDGGEEEEFSFRLFSTTTTSKSSKPLPSTTLPTAATTPAPPTAKIRLRSPSLETAQPDFVRKRPESYYFTPSPTPETQAQLEESVVSGETVIARAKAAWPGCAKPWKTQTLPRTALSKALRAAEDGRVRNILATHSKSEDGRTDKAKKRARKGKKTRIALRKKLRSREEAKARAEKEAAEREAAEKEKKTRRNREKKVKKRERDKAKKAAETAGIGGAEGETEGQKDAARGSD